MVLTSKTSSILLNKQSQTSVSPSSQSEKVFIGTRVTRLGPDRDYTYDVDILQYSKSSEGGFISPKVIGKRDSGNPNKITWNDNAPDIVKKSWNNDKLVNTVKDQMRSMEDKFVQSSINRENYRRDNGFRSFGKDTFPDTSIPLLNTLQARTNPPAPTVTGFKYPFDMDIDNQDTLKIEIYERKARDFRQGTAAKKFTDGGTTNDRDLGAPLGQIILPINGQVPNDNLSVNYDENSLNIIQAAIAANINEALRDEKNKEATISGSTAGGILEKLNVTEASLKSYIGAAAGANAASALTGSKIDLNTLTSRLNAEILNPNMELLFKSPQLRSFGFQYLMLPRDADEAKQVVGIIRMLKSNMVPQVKTGTYFLKTPNIFKLQYMRGSGVHEFLNKFKMCALRSCDIQYAPLGTYSTYFDGVMHAYRMTLQFTELDPVYSEDYEEANTGPVPIANNGALPVFNNGKGTIGY